MIDVVEQQGLMWDRVSSLVGSKTPEECRRFFNSRLLPFLMEHNKPPTFIGAAGARKIGIPNQEMVEACIDEAKRWCEHVGNMEGEAET